MWGNWFLIFRGLQLNTESIDASRYHGCEVFAAYSRQEEVPSYKDRRSNYDMFDIKILRHFHISDIRETY